jgi:hypothetical protein
MRPTLTHSRSDRRRRHIGAPWRRSRDIELQPIGGASADATEEKERKRVIASSLETCLDSDSNAARARAAGGPVDLASYSCECGFVFSASVSTTVACPHCGAEQAW